MTFPYILPDILVVVLAVLLMGLDLAKVRANALHHVAWIGTAAILVLLNLVPAGWDRAWLGGNWNLTNMGLLFRELFLSSSLAAILLARRNFQLGEEGGAPLRYRSEFLASILFVTFGSITVVSGDNLLTLFVGLELATIPLYFLTAWNKQSRLSQEASTKYVLLGSTSTAIMLFGFSYLYGFAGAVRFDQIAMHAVSQSDSPLLWIGVLFLMAGIGFKLTLFPFHSWAPDVYEGAPTPITAFLSVSSKATAVAFLLVMLYGPLASLHDQLTPLIALLAAATMTIGNLGAIKQIRIRRFMAWSSIGQAGYLMLAMVGPGISAKSSIIFYMFIYAFSNYLVFFLVTGIANQRQLTFDNLAGIARHRPWLGAAMAIAAFSLAGVPPLAGFMGKFTLFASAAEADQYILLAIAGLNTVVSLFIYLQLLKSAWVDEPTAEQIASHQSFTFSWMEKISIVVLSILVLVAGTLPWLGDNILMILQLGK